MQNACRLTIDGNVVIFEVTQVLHAAVEHQEFDPFQLVLVVTTVRDGENIWSGVVLQDVSDGIPIDEQYTMAQLTEFYRQARRKWLNPLRSLDDQRKLHSGSLLGTTSTFA